MKKIVVPKIQKLVNMLCLLDMDFKKGNLLPSKYERVFNPILCSNHVWYPDYISVCLIFCIS